MREKLGPYAHLIETVRGVGYRAVNEAMFNGVSRDPTRLQRIMGWSLLLSAVSRGALGSTAPSVGLIHERMRRGQSVAAA